MKGTARLGSRSGQGLTEYIIIVAIVAVGSLAILGLFGQQIKGGF